MRGLTTLLTVAIKPATPYGGLVVLLIGDVLNYSLPVCASERS